MRPDAALENRIAIVQKMLRRNGGGDAGPGRGHELHGALRRDVLEHHLQLPESARAAVQVPYR